MNVSVTDIQVPAGGLAAGVPMDVVVKLIVDGEEFEYSFVVKQFAVGAGSHPLVQPDRRLYDQFRNHQVAIGQVCQLVGQAVEAGSVHLPQRIAA